MKTYVVAVSGGVDSVVLLDMLAKVAEAQLVIAHFDHGIREDAAEDAAFVQQLAQQYNLPFESGHAELGSKASEEKARTARYAFLRQIAKKYHAQIVTAHHADDVLETMIINISRGTGWRGLASLRTTSEILRPLLKYRKKQLLEYATQHNLEWREDSTNSETNYLRNHIRHNLVLKLGLQAEQWLLNLYENQLTIRVEVEEVAKELQPFCKEADRYRRYPFIMTDPSLSLELLQEYLFFETGKSTTRPRLQRALLAIKTAHPDTIHQLGEGISLRFSKRHFEILREVK